MSDEKSLKSRAQGWIVAAIGLTVIYAIYAATNAIPPTPAAAEAVQPQATRRPTRTPAPTAGMPTPDYLATNVFLRSVADAAQGDAAAAQQRAIFAQQTAVEADVQAAQIQRDREQIALDAQRLAVQATQAAAVITQTAYPMIATADALRIADAQQQRAYDSAAPLRAQAMAEAQYQAEYGWLDAWVKIAIIAVLFALTALSVAHVVLWVWKAATPAPAPAEAHFIEPEPEEAVEVDPFRNYTPVMLQRPNGQFRAADAHLIPCTPEQLTTLARGLLEENRTLAQRNWEGKYPLFTRRTFSNLMGWMLRPDVEFATDRKSETYSLTAKGEGFLLAWLEDQTAPPPPFIFAPNYTQDAGENNHGRENHGRDSGGGVGDAVNRGTGGGL